MTKLVRFGLSVGVLTAMAMAPGCSPAPGIPMTSSAKGYDIAWFFAMYEENYAPLEYKEQRYGFKFEDLKAKYLAQAQATKTNEEYYKVVYNFVAEFRDAHNAASINNAGLPGRAQIAYLGFTGKRHGDALRVTDFLPNSRSAQFPVKAGDLIQKLNGVPLTEVVKNEMVPWRDLGQDEANLTYHMPRIFGRVSTSSGQPAGKLALLTIKRGQTTVEIPLPWVVQDLAKFKSEQSQIARERTSSTNELVETLGLEDSGLAAIFKMGYRDYYGDITNVNRAFEKISRLMPDFKWTNTFRFIDDAPVWMMELEKAVGVEKESAVVANPSLVTLAKERYVPADADPVPGSRVFPAYTITQTSEEGKTLTYLRVNTFSPQSSENEIINELKTLLKTMKIRRSNDLVIDLLDNGGGSLSLGLRMAQALSNVRLVMPEIQLKLSNGWRDQFLRTSEDLEAISAERAIATEMGKLIDEDLAAGKRLSRKVDTQAILDFESQSSAERADRKINIVLMVNEMCASMCDIFTAVLKDNQMAKVVGARTMGAGGNVVDHAAAPISNMQVRQTESLILRGDGATYIENNGIEPDVTMAVNESLVNKYSEVVNKAFALLTASADEKPSNASSTATPETVSPVTTTP